MQDDIKDFDTPEQEVENLAAEQQAEHRGNLGFHAEVWGKLSRIDVSDHIETADIQSKTGASYQYTYLSWSWAWATLMKVYPASNFVLLDEERFFDGTVNVRVIVTIRDLAGHSMDRFSWLPVMNRKNQAIQNPDARSINDARMRCLVKALAFCGLGLDLWTGSDTPVGVIEDPLSPEQLDQVNKLIEKAQPDITRFLKWLKADSVEEIEQGKYKQCIAELERAIKRKSQQS